MPPPGSILKKSVGILENNAKVLKSGAIYHFLSFVYKLEMRCFLRKLATNAMHGSAVKRSIFLWSGRSADATMTFQAAIEISCHDHSTTVWVGRCYILLRYLVFVFVVRFLFIR